MIYVPYEIWIAGVILITYGLFPIVCGWPSLHCLILKVSVFSALEVLSWLLEMERLCSRVHLMQGWKLFSARNCQRYLLTLAISFYHVTAELLSSVHAQWSFLKKKPNKFSTLCIIHHWACLISVSILSIGISVLLLLRTAWFFIFHYQLVWTPGSRTLSLSYGKTDNSIAPVLADPEASF